MSKGQASTIDLFASIAVFIVVVSFIVYYYSYTSNRVQRDFNYEELQIRAYRIADILTKTPGDPSRWEALPGSQIDATKMSSIGLAINDRQLSPDKVKNLTRISYDDLKTLLNIGPYDFNLTLKIKDDILTLLKKYDIRIAYIQIGTKSFHDSLRLQMQGLFDCKPADSITNRNEERCEEYLNTNVLNNPDGAGLAFASSFNIFNNLSEYDLVIMEDPKLQTDPFDTSNNEPTYPHSQKIINYTKNGGFIFTTVAMAVGVSRVHLLGANWTDGTFIASTLTPTDIYYNARDNGDERFIVLPDGSLLTSNKKASYISPTSNTSNFLHILYPDSSNSLASGARWDFGKGRVYYFSDGRDIVLSDEVGVASRRIVQDLAASLFSNILTSGKTPPKDAEIVTVQRDVLYGNQTAILEVTMWESS